jgi:cholest-4-en-3-one 26-monooxygenase
MGMAQTIAIKASVESDDESDILETRFSAPRTSPAHRNWRPTMALRPGDIDLTDPDVFLNAGGPPHDYFEVLRREAPVFWHEAPSVQKSITPITKGFWVISKHADLVHVSRSPKIFSSEVGTSFLWESDEEMLPLVQSIMINMDPPQHVKYRRLVQPGFTPKMVKEIEPTIRKHARDIVDRVAEKGECEFVEDLASELPLTLICELVGIPYEDRKKIFEWSNNMIGGDDPDLAPSADASGTASAAMWLYCNELAEEKRRNPDDTLISKYVHGSVDGEKITEQELNHFFVLLAVAGNETTRNMTSHFMRLLFEHPDQYELLRSDVPRYLPGAVEEALRFSPPVMNFRRTAIQDTEIRGSQIKAGDKIYLSYPSANRDEEVFTDSMKFDITREKNDHIAFGIGEHFCLGANLARMQLNAILGEVLTRLPVLRPTQAPRIQRSNFIHGITRMPVSFTPPS